MDALRQAIREYWGYETLRPLQEDAMAAAVAGRDSFVVLPTGGGKSLCYQAPAIVADHLTVVVSPLIALMKDQVDGLIQRGIEAAFINSTLEYADKRIIADGVRNQRYKMLFVAPERFTGEPFYKFLEQGRVGSFAIDEAHCISHWGHDFREDYRRLGELKQRFPNAAVHAFTATATPKVRADVLEQLGLHEPAVLIGDFYRPNLNYHVRRRQGEFQQIIDDVLQRKGQAGIVYCIRRKDVDELTAMLRSAGINAVGYHAGLSDEQRTAAQDSFSRGQTDVVVATVAFGMGIDRSDIRFVVHAAMPKSIEHYQQETGRAGRDGKPADCVLYFSGRDFQLWKSLLEREQSPYTDDLVSMLSEMYGYCQAATCRHRTLVSYFGQAWERNGCSACDVCNGLIERLDDGNEIAKKILTAVVQTGERFGAGHVTDVLLGIDTDKVIERDHAHLPCFGTLANQSKSAIMTWIEQLTGQGMLERVGEYRVIELAEKGWEVLKDKGEAFLTPAASKKKSTRTRPPRQSRTRTTTSAAPTVLDAEGKELFERLKALRREIAAELESPAFVVFSDRTLRELAAARPKGRTQFLDVKGAGPAKWDAFGQRFVDEIARTD